MESELCGRVKSRVKYVVVHPRVSNGEYEVVALAQFGPRAHNKGLRFSVDDGPRAKGEIFFRPQGFGVSGIEPGDAAPLRDKGGGEPRERSGALVGIFFRGGEEPSQPESVALRSDIDNNIGDLAWPLGRSRDLVRLRKAK